MLAKNENDLITGQKLWDALNSWQAHAEKIGDLVYVYASNGSKFDAFPVIYFSMCATNEPVKDMVVSNGSCISFSWKYTACEFQKEKSHCNPGIIIIEK